MKTIFITISRGSLIRNFFHTGVISRLLENFRLVILTPNYKDLDLFKDYRHENLFLEPLVMVPNKLRFEKLILEFLRGASFNRTIYTLFYKYGVEGAKRPNRMLFIFRIMFLAPLRFIPYFKKFIRWVDFKINPQMEHDYLFAKYKPDLVFATACNAEADAGVLKSAKRFEVKTAQMPKSWDNPSLALFYVKTDYILAWSPFVKKQLLKLQDYKEKEVFTVGVPQFDYYHNKSNLISREEFCRKFNFNPNKKIILHASSGVIADEESRYIELIKRFIDEGKLADAQILVRPHSGFPKDREGYKYLEKKYAGVAVDTADHFDNRFKDNWDTSLNHLKHLFNSLHHADVCANIASTITLDAAACGTPVININFTPGEFDKYGLIKQLKGLDYVRALMDTGATWLANSKGEFLEYLKNVLEKGLDKKDELKQKMIYNFMYKNDGNSAKRITDALSNIASQ